MDRKLAGIAGITLLVLLAGCSGIGATAADTPADDGPERTIEVTADGEATAEPDRATISVAVEARGEDSQAVRDELAEGDEALQSALLDWGLTEDDVRTEHYRVRESRESRQEPNVTEYTGVHQYAIEVDDVTAVGDVIDVAVDAGADSVHRIEFGLSDEREDELREEALANAMENADTEAAVLAENADLEVTGVHAISTANTRTRPYATAEVAQTGAGDAGAGTSVQPGDVDVSVTVNVVFEAEEA